MHTFLTKSLDQKAHPVFSVVDSASAYPGTPGRWRLWEAALPASGTAQAPGQRMPTAALPLTPASSGAARRLCQAHRPIVGLLQPPGPSASDTLSPIASGPGWDFRYRSRLTTTITARQGAVRKSLNFTKFGLKHSLRQKQKKNKQVRRLSDKSQKPKQPLQNF